MDTSAAGDQITTRVVRTVDNGLVQAVDRLVVQLSDAASSPGRWEFDQILADPGVVLLVAEAGALIVGILALVIFRTPTGVHSRIGDLIVDEFEATGVSERLIKRAIRSASSRGAQTLDASATSHTDAAAIYERLGFERRSTNAYRYKISG